MTLEDEEQQPTYGGTGLQKFKALPVAFQSGAVTIYRATGLTGQVGAVQ